MSRNQRVRVVVLTGTPGTGKTTISHLIAQILCVKLFSLSDLAVEAGAVTGEDIERDTLIVDGAVLKRFLNRFLSNMSGLVVFEGHYGELVPKRFVDCCIVLRARPSVLEKRLTERGYSGRKLLENLQAEVLGTCTFNAVEAYGRGLVYELDTSSDSVQVTVGNALRIISEKPSVFLAGWVNWFNELSEEEFRKYFNY
ncbi:MAG: AAA family ATPase [Candidatus Odinarchaeum yellowstonii]|uniref:Putative adenylate kinase n=1 Tax=Odinarchaeota yellowstonii (strain LCB_4) TaxID=1841599 RepID=A0AAF0D2M2_ODILC|nr:MAG: AAA family ATPase [Candidatus Odinarchaeum yellowstonii]